MTKTEANNLSYNVNEYSCLEIFKLISEAAMAGKYHLVVDDLSLEQRQVLINNLYRIDVVDYREIISWAND